MFQIVTVLLFFQVLCEYYERTGDLKLHTVHDGAANMLKASRLLGVQDTMHCLAHATHLLLTVDGFNHVPEVCHLIERCKNIITTLRYKSYEISQEALYAADATFISNLQQLLEADEIMSLDEQFPLNYIYKPLTNTAMIKNIPVKIVLMSSNMQH